MKIYHGCCELVDTNGTRKLLETVEKCDWVTSRSFWKYPQDCMNGVKTRAAIKRNRLAKAIKWEIKEYFCKIKNKDNYIKECDVYFYNNNNTFWLYNLFTIQDFCLSKVSNIIETKIVGSATAKYLPCQFYLSKASKLDKLLLLAHVIIIFCSFSYCRTMSPFLFWSFKMNSSFSKSSTVAFDSFSLLCILLFTLGLNKLLSQYIWKIPQFTLSRSWVWSCISYKFTKSLTLSLFPNNWIKQRKSCAVSLKLSISLLLILLQAFIESFIFTSIILLSVIVIFSVPLSIFSIIFLLSCVMKLFKPLIRNESKQKIYLWFNVQYAPPMRTFYFWAISIGN